MNATTEKTKIAVISHAFVTPVSQNRWKRLAEDPNYEVHLIVPREWESTWFEEKIVFEPKEVHEGNFHVHLLPTTSKSNWTRYFFISLDGKFREIKPDLIYIVHEESILVHHQIYLYRRFFAPDSKIIFFSMNALGVPDKTFIHRLLWKNVKNNTDAALAHYPGCLSSLRNGGYNKPIYLQTQVGVDEKLFRPDIAAREEYRKKLGFEDKFVIGYTGRLTEEKGVDDLFNIFPLEDIDWALLMVGNGPLYKDIEKRVQEKGWEKRVYLTGFIDQAEVPAYMNAMDCFVLGSKTTPEWVDTFPLVTVQAQATGLPIVASDSGSLPWQLADTALFFHEGDVNELKEKVLLYAFDSQLRDEYAKKGRHRSLEYFCHEGMTTEFKKIVSQVLNDDISYHLENEEYKQWKAY